MRASIVSAAFVMVGTGSVLASAATDWFGSDALFVMTNDVMSQCDVKFPNPHDGR